MSDRKGQPADAAETFRAAATGTVEEARKAFTSALDNARKTVDSLDASTADAEGRMRALTRDSVDFAGDSALAAFDFIERFARVRTPEDALALQKAFVEDQMARFGRRTRELGDQMIRTAQDLTKPFES